MRLSILFLSLFALCFAGYTKTAYSDFDIDKKLWLPIGINFGYTWTDATADGQGQDSGFLGFEVSTVMTLESSVWFGAYFDAIFPLDADAATARISFGPEIGFAFLGMDGGYVAEFYDGNASEGVQVRFLFYWVIGGIYVRTGALWSDDTDGARGFTEAGMLFKLPLD
jgi:hypothetical protein